MTDPLDLQSEPYSVYGNISGQGLGKILGTPRHDRLKIALRESVQNSWDARVPDNGPLRFRIDLRTLGPEQVEVLRRSMLTEFPEQSPSTENLKTSLGTDSLRVLEISDFGTSGLGGPLRADVDADSEVTDFVDFLRNVGSPRDKEHGGGTYGYGKTSLYVLSRCQLICVHTMAEVQGEPSERLMACCLGDPFSVSGRQFTGRHWWGRWADDEVVDPLLGAEASEIAAVLGLPDRRDEVFGTSILIIDPDLEHRSPEQAVDAVRESILWFFWPKLVRYEDGSAPMEFDVRLDGEPNDVPSLESFGPFPLFTEAMQKLKAGDEDDVFDIECRNPIKGLGKLAVSRGFKKPRIEFDTGDENSEMPGHSSHIALMRPAELVVSYLTGERLPSELIEYGGVFICDDSVESAFAASEPPAHDEWVPDYLTGHDKTFVNVALRRIRERLKEFVVGRDPQPEGTDLDPTALGPLADSLGGLLIGQAGERVVPGEPTPGSHRTGPRSTGRVRPRVSRPVSAGLWEIKGTPCAVFRITVTTTRSELVSLGASAWVLGLGEDRQNDDDGPRIVGWFDPADDGRRISKENHLTFDVEARRELLVAVSIPNDLGVTIDVRLREHE